MKKKMFFVVTAALIAVLIGFTSCSQSASSVLSGGKEDTPSVPPGTGGGGSLPSVPKVELNSELHGSYWGDMAFGNEKGKVCVVVKADTVGVHSKVMGSIYPLLKPENKGNGIWTVNCYKEGDDTEEESERVILTIDTTRNPVTCKLRIIPMNNTEALCTKGEAYNGEKDKLK